MLVADGLPTEDNPGGRWWVDVGLGDAFRDPVAVTVGRHDQSGFRYEITEVRDDGWSFRHDRAGTFTGIEISTRSTEQQVVEQRTRGSRRPARAGSRRCWSCSAATRPASTPCAAACGTASSPTARPRPSSTSYDSWREALVDGTRLSLEDIDDGELRALYAAQWSKHLAWTAAGRP